MVRRELELGGGVGGERGEKKQQQNFLGSCPIKEVFLRKRLPQLALHSSWKCKTLKIFTCHDGTVSLTFNLTQLFYFKNISFFSANKSKHTASNQKYLKRQKSRGSSFNFHFHGRVPYEGNQGICDTHLYTMHTKPQVLNRKMNSFLSLKLNMWKCKNKKASHTEVYITEILQSRHDRKTGHA